MVCLTTRRALVITIVPVLLTESESDDRFKVKDPASLEASRDGIDCGHVDEGEVGREDGGREAGPLPQPSKDMVTGGAM